MDTYQTLNILAAIPEFLIWFAGGLLCLYWSRLRPATAMLIGLAVLMAGVRRGAVLFAPEISFYLEAFSLSAEQRMLTLYLLFSIPNSLAWGMILLAVHRELRHHHNEGLH